MSLEHTIQLPKRKVPSWSALRNALADRGIESALRMIDGLPALPDEEPPEEWRELRVGFAAGMVTLRREGDTLRCLIWGNADFALQAAWHTLAEVCQRVLDGS